jgi:hypothetical protein
MLSIKNKIYSVFLLSLSMFTSTHGHPYTQIAEGILAVLRCPASIILNKESDGNLSKTKKIFANAVRVSHEIISLINQKEELSTPNICHLTPWLAYDIYQLLMSFVYKKPIKRNKFSRFSKSKFKQILKTISLLHLPFLEAFIALKIPHSHMNDYPFFQDRSFFLDPLHIQSLFCVDHSFHNKLVAKREKSYALLSLLRIIYEYATSEDGSKKEKITLGLMLANIASYCACVNRYDNAKPAPRVINSNNDAKYDVCYIADIEGKKKKIIVTNKRTKKPVVEDGDDECVICQEGYFDDSNNPLDDNENNIVLFNNCGHIFHSVCALNWLERHKNCPSCRKYTFPDKDLVNVDLENIQEARH